MILSRGTAQTQEAVIAEYHQFLDRFQLSTNRRRLEELRSAAAVLCRLIGKSPLQWSDDDILSIYQTRGQSSTSRYNVFLAFLFFRGYHRPGIHLLLTLPLDLAVQWKQVVAPYHERVNRTTAELGYEMTAGASAVVTILLCLLISASKPLEEITRADFEAFREAWLDEGQRRKDGSPDPRLYRLEQYLIHWGSIPAAKGIYTYEKRFACLQHESIRAAISRYLKWCEVKYRPSTLESHRAALLAFFLWLQESSPEVSRLDGTSRTIALAYAHYLKEQAAAGRYSKGYQCDLYSLVRQFFDFVIDERLDTAPARNPFSLRDLPKRPEMIPRYLPDQELRKILEYGEHEATLFERTLIITLLHTGIRAMEFAQLKSSDIVQIGGVWKLHIREGKGLKDRLIPLTSHCLAVLQAWQEQGWEHVNEHLFTYHGRPWQTTSRVTVTVEQIGHKLGITGLTAHRFRHTFAVALLNYGIRESALQKLMGHASLNMTLEYARILDQTVEQSFGQAIEHMQEGAHSWVPNFFAQEDYTRFVEGDAVSWIRLPMGYCRRNAKLHCESDVKCLLCDRFAIGKEDLPRLQQMHERFMKLGLKVKADVVAAQIQRLELPSGDVPSGFIPATTIAVARRHR
jgi:site-specific recombinase XerD